MEPAHEAAERLVGDEWVPSVPEVTPASPGVGRAEQAEGLPS